MSTYPSNLLYTKDHEWIRVEGAQAVLGITQFAQRELGEVVYVELPSVGDRFEQSAPIGSIESVKAVAEVYIPVSGKITAINEALNNDPETLNDDPHGDGWLVNFQIEDDSQLKSLLSAEEYEDFIKSGEEE